MLLSKYLLVLMRSRKLIWTFRC